MGFWSINPYIGCEFGCAYCYARDTHRWMVERASSRPDAPATAREAATLAPSEAFERRILVKQGAAEILARTLDPARLGGRPVVIGTATDPYQPAERRFGLTRALLQTFRNYEGLHLGIITKSALIRRDIALLAELNRQHQVTVNISLASLDAPLLRRLEPRTPVPQARLRALRDLVAAGITVNLLIAPILPGLTDATDALRALIFAAKDAGASWAGGEPLRMNDATRGTLYPWLQRERPQLADRYRRHYQRRLTVSPRYATALKERITLLRREAGFTRTAEWAPEREASGPAAPQLELGLPGQGGTKATSQHTT
jgi:DNA repair photolyase